MMPQSVRLFGLSIRSEIPLPGLEPEAAATDPDVVIEFGRVPKPSGPAAELVVDKGGATLTIDGVARYRISNGSRITVQSEAGAPEANVRLFLLGSAMGVLLHQRGLLPLHASAVEVDGRAIAFIGPSGAGKSTLAAAFHDQGHRLIADDVCVIGFDGEGRAFARPGIPRLRLWEEALAASGRAPEGYELSYAGDESFRKYDVPIPPRVDQQGETRVAAVLDLRTEESVQFRPMIGSEAVEAIFANTYRGEYLQAAGQPSAHWQAAVGLIRGVAVFELSRPRELGRLAGDVGRIAEFVRQLETKER
jgi:hypothetical protein